MPDGGWARGEAAPLEAGPVAASAALTDPPALVAGAFGDSAAARPPEGWRSRRLAATW